MKKIPQSFRYILFIAFIGGLSACNKDDNEVISGTSRLSVTNAATEVPALDAYIQGEKITTAPLAFGSTTGIAGNPYVTVDAGTRFMSISPDGTTNLVQGSIPLRADSSYSVFAYDTINTSGTLRVLLLTDKLSAPATGRAHYRFLQLSRDTGRIFVRLVNGADTIPVGYKSYITATSATELSTLSGFTSVNAGNYTLQVRLTDSTPVVYSVPVSLAEGKIVTFFARGRKNIPTGPSMFQVNAITHN